MAHQELLQWLNAYMAATGATANSISIKINDAPTKYGRTGGKLISPATIRDFRNGKLIREPTAELLTRFLAIEAPTHQPEQPMRSFPINLRTFFNTPQIELDRFAGILGTYQTYADTPISGTCCRGSAQFEKADGQFSVRITQRVYSQFEFDSEERKWEGFATPKGSTLFAVMHTVRDEAAATPLFMIFEVGKNRGGPDGQAATVLWAYTLGWRQGTEPFERVDRNTFIMEKREHSSIQIDTCQEADIDARFLAELKKFRS